MSAIEWIFSGIGTTVFVSIATFLYRKRKKNVDSKEIESTSVSSSVKEKSLNSGIIATSKGNQTINVYGDTSDNKNGDKKLETKVLMKVEVPILFIDDKKFEIIKYLRDRGWTETKRIKDLKNFDDPEVIKSKIIFVDIIGVGIHLNLKGEGLELAVQLKKRYPDKKVALYSSESKHDIFGEGIDILDARIQKNADPIKFLNLVEQFMQEL